MKHTSRGPSRILPAVTLTLAAGACGVDDPSHELTTTAEEASPLEVTTITMQQNSGIGDEHCRVDASRIAAWPAGRQLVIYRGSTLRGMCTVDALTHNLGANVVLVNYDVMKRRVWASSTDGSTVPSSITNVTLRDQQTSMSAAPAVVGSTSTVSSLETDDNTPREFLSTIPSLDPVLHPHEVTVAYTSPHPWENPAPSGDIGKAFAQWRAVENARDLDHDAYWSIGFAGNDGDFITDPDDSTKTIGNTARFHVTATEIDRDSFPGLGSLIDADLDYAVSFHGTAKSSSAAACNQGLLVGGGLGLHLTNDTMAFRRGIAENIRLLVDPSDPTPPSPAGSGDHLELLPDQVRYSSGQCGFSEGVAAENFVNRIARYTVGSTTVLRGVQLESGGRLDKALYERVGTAVREVFDCLNVAPDATVSSTYWFSARQSSGTTYTSGRCRGFVVDATLNSYADKFWGELQTCQVGGKTHLDVYRWNEDAGSWDRVAGGTRVYTSCSPSIAFTETAYDDNPSDSFTPSFDHTLTGATSGLYRLGIYGYTGDFFTTANALAVQARASG